MRALLTAITLLLAGGPSGVQAQTDVVPRCLGLR